MYYAINHDAQLGTKRMTIFESKSERDAWVDRHHKSDAFAVTAKQAERWVRHVFEVDTHGTEPYHYYPDWLEDALDGAVDAYGTYDATVYVIG